MPYGHHSSRPDASPHPLTLVLFFAASSAPSPLYGLYQHRWGFSPLLLTLVFAIYALALLVALLTAGRLSDQLGRRRVILGALAGEIFAMLGLFFAQDVTWLLAARLVQGFVTGIAVSALGAAITDANHTRGPLLNATLPMVGLGTGALGAALLAHFAPAPLHLSFAVLIAAFVVQAARTTALRETPPVRTGPISLRPRIAVSPHARPVLLAVTPAVIATWALGGFYLALLPSLLAAVTGRPGGTMGGIAIAALTTTATISIVFARRHKPSLTLPLGASGLIAGVALILAGMHLGSFGILAVGSVLGGAGFGAGYFGAVSSVLPLAPPQERSALMAAFYVECYLGHALPVIVAGAAVRKIGLLTTVDVYGGMLITLAALALVIALARRATARRVMVAAAE